MAVLQQKVSQIASASIVIPTYQRLDLALQAVECIRKYYPDIEVIVVDQCNNNPVSKTAIDKLKIKYFHLTEGNVSRARNFGLRQAEGEVVFFLDDDLEITSTTVSAQIEAYSDPEVVGTVGRVINDHEVIPGDTDVVTGRTNKLGTSFSFRFWSTRRQFVDFPYGCNMSFKKTVLQKAGGFDEHYSKIFDEVDMGVRVSRRYGKIAFVPEGLAYHHKAATGGTRTSERQRQIMVYSYYGYYLAKEVPFPLSVISLALRTKSALFEAPYAIRQLYGGYLSYFFKK